ncbi:flagellar motor protein MotB [Pusillimonas sp.]|uniref:flagellar motor protein MotB n=1 Tax=Pusillimonas sp. TaxID=3040095 RepID=UPI0029BCE1FD|nr:flagellar motor protein MotB [Pusillimonas sp.]MDX3894076.1 flagellar motor protein MotB [Pusillimonas sp.]
MKPTATDRIVIRRKRSPAQPHHGGAWKIAYADYMTAMMSFFLIMWILSLIPRDDLTGIAEYFRMPLMTAIQGGPNIDTSRSVIPGASPSPIPSKHPITQPPVDSSRGAELRRDTERLEDLKTDLETLIDTNPVLQEFRPQLLLDMTPDGLRIQIVDRQNRPMFATGRAQVQPYMRDVLRELGPVFNRLPNSITISGHTDAVQYASGERLYSNWELSADRANAARQELVAGGMEERKIKRVLGLSSTVSLVKDDPNAAVNRRISIVVLNRIAEERIDAQNAAGSSDPRFYEALQPAPVDERLSPLPGDESGEAAQQR